MLNSDVPSLTPQLIADLFNKDYWTHQKAVQALLDLGFPRPPLTEDVLFLHLQQHAANIVRARAAMILGSLSDQRAIDALIRALADPNAEVRIEAARALAIHGDRVDFQVWLSLLDAPRVHYSALKGLMMHPQDVAFRIRSRSKGNQDRRNGGLSIIADHNGSLPFANRCH